MSLNLAEKQAVVAEVAKVAASAHSAIAAEYRGLSVAQIMALRVKARETGVYLRVVKNTLARRAVQGQKLTRRAGHGWVCEQARAPHAGVGRCSPCRWG